MARAWKIEDVENVPQVRILGIPIVRTDAKEALAALERLYEADTPALVAFVNAHTLNMTATDPSFREVISRADIILNDGSGVELAARMRGVRFPENLNGTDFLPRFLRRAADRGWSISFVGAAPGVADRAAVALTEAIPGLKVVSTHHGFFRDAEGAEVARRIREGSPDVVMAAMGNPRQERWLAEHLGETGARMGIGVGAFLDFTVGAQKRAPRWMSKAGIEWAYRLAREPRRMWQRYVVGNPVFLARAWRSRRSDIDGVSHG